MEHQRFLLFSQELPAEVEQKDQGSLVNGNAKFQNTNFKHEDAVKTCLATASERSPLSANLSIIAWTFLFASSLRLHKVMICSQNKPH